MPSKAFPQKGPSKTAQAVFPKNLTNDSSRESPRSFLGISLEASHSIIFGQDVPGKTPGGIPRSPPRRISGVTLVGISGKFMKDILANSRFFLCEIGNRRRVSTDGTTNSLALKEF